MSRDMNWSWVPDFHLAHHYRAVLGVLDQKTITTWKQMVFRAVHYFKAPLIPFIIDAVEEQRFFDKFF